MKTSEVSQLFCTPGEQTLTQIFDKALSNMVEPYLLREFYNWDAGPILRWDGQYKIAAKTTNDPLVEGEINTLIFVQGTHDQILAANFMDAESSVSLFIAVKPEYILQQPAMLPRAKRKILDDNMADNKIKSVECTGAWIRTRSICPNPERHQGLMQKTSARTPRIKKKI